MSRIHEALKKAEAERARAGSGNHAMDSEAEVPPGRTSESHVALDRATQTAKDSNPHYYSESPTTQVPNSFGSMLENIRKAPSQETAGDNGSSRIATTSPGACSPALLEKCARIDWTPTSGKTLSANGNEYRIGAEEFRTLRSSLELARRQRPLKTILVTSPLPKEGKTFVAVNLAQALGWQREQRVLLMDGDLRLASVHTCFGNIPQEPGLADYLSGDVDPISLIRRGRGSNLFVLPAGRAGSNPLELISNGRLKSLIQWFAPAFDWIVIDSPPAIPVSDSRLIAEFCDAVLFVVRAGQTPADLAERAIGLVRGKRYVGTVLNAVDSSLTASSYYYDDNNTGGNRKAVS